ncbi:MAG: hypothetical protein KC563_12455, partial [Nitrospira sp.]|nr:hypothetical protein [Nitrospira sp.]MCA9478786.1 hypothetical protein [Nitrospira sp.]
MPMSFNNPTDLNSPNTSESGDSPTDDLRRQQIHQLFSVVPIAILASVVNASLVGFILIEVIRPSWVIGWLLGILGINVVWAGL